MGFIGIGISKCENFCKLQIKKWYKGFKQNLKKKINTINNERNKMKNSRKSNKDL